MNNVERLTDRISVRSAEDLHDEDLCSIFSELIATVSEDRRQLRMLVYEVARRKLRTSLLRAFRGWKLGGGPAAIAGPRTRH